MGIGALPLAVQHCLLVSKPFFSFLFKFTPMNQNIITCLPICCWLSVYRHNSPKLPRHEVSKTPEDVLWYLAPER